MDIIGRTYMLITSGSYRIKTSFLCIQCLVLSCNTCAGNTYLVDITQCLVLRRSVHLLVIGTQFACQNKQLYFKVSFLNKPDGCNSQKNNSKQYRSKRCRGIDNFCTCILKKKMLNSKLVYSQSNFRTRKNSSSLSVALSP